MRLRTLVVACAVAVGLMAAAPIAASANIVWCAGDPPVQVVTPGGHNLLINNYLYVAAGDVRLAGQVTVSGDAVADGPGATKVTIDVNVPEDLSRLYVVSTDQQFQVTDSAEGAAGSQITLTLDVPEP